MNSKRGGSGPQGRPTGYQRTANNEYEEIRAPSSNNQPNTQAANAKRAGEKQNNPKGASGNA